MYREALQNDLKAIFKVKRVDIGRAVETCIEQGILCADIDSTRLTATDGKATARVEGQIGLRGTDKQNMSGYLLKKVNEAPAELTSRFWFSAREENTSFSPADFELKGYKIRFTYFYKEEYNPPKGLLKWARWWWRLTGVKNNG